MTAPKTKTPIASFGPELMAFLTKSGREKVVLRFDGERGYSAANIFRRRIHTLRQRMREENHPDYVFAARAKISLYWGPSAVEEGGPEEWIEDHNHHRGALIVGRPHDREFLSVLQDAGISVKDEAPRTQSPTVSPEPSRFAGLLDDLEPFMTPSEDKK